MKKETQEVRSLRRALAEAYLSERAARKKELSAVKAKEAALRDVQKAFGDRLSQVEARVDALAKAEQKPTGVDEQTKQWMKKVDDGLKELEWRTEWVDYPGKKKRNLYLSGP